MPSQMDEYLARERAPERFVKKLAEASRLADEKQEHFVEECRHAKVVLLQDGQRGLLVGGRVISVECGLESVGGASVADLLARALRGDGERKEADSA